MNKETLSANHSAPSPSPAEPGAVRWWDPLDLTVGDTLLWQVGPLQLRVQRLAQEWRLAYAPLRTAQDATGWARTPQAAWAPEADDVVERVAFGRTAPRLAVTPALADRPVVLRPETPFWIPPGEEIRLFASTPLWAAIHVHQPPVLLRELPIQSVSDTWLGPSTREGELCYDSRTRARRALSDLPIRPHRAVTPIRLRNRATEPLLLERVSLPMPILPLLVDTTHRLWTPSVTLTRERNDDLATLQVDTHPSQDLPATQPVAPARQAADTRVLVRAFGSLFSAWP